MLPITGPPLLRGPPASPLAPPRGRWESKRVENRWTKQWTPDRFVEKKILYSVGIRELGYRRPRCVLPTPSTSKCKWPGQAESKTFPVSTTHRRICRTSPSLSAIPKCYAVPDLFSIAPIPPPCVANKAKNIRLPSLPPQIPPHPCSSLGETVDGVPRPQAEYLPQHLMGLVTLPQAEGAGKVGSQHVDLLDVGEQRLVNGLLVGSTAAVDCLLLLKPPPLVLKAQTKDGQPGTIDEIENLPGAPLPA